MIVKKLKFNKKSDHRGSLIPIESLKDLPFNMERLFYIKGLNDEPRGFHSHRKTVQVIVTLNGSFTIDTIHNNVTETFTLDSDDEGLLLPVDTWVKMYNFSEDCIILVLCSYHYDEKEYVRDFEIFKSLQSSVTDNVIRCFEMVDYNNHPQLKLDLHRRIQDVISRNAFVLGKELETFESNFAKYLDTPYCVGVSNGTSALVCALKALDLPLNSEIIVQSNTYIAAPLAIEMANHTIKVVDIDDNLNLDLDLLEQSITDKTRAVIVVHLYGMCPDMNRLLELKRKYGFYLIEDAAQAHGSTFENKKLGTFGDIGCFSFYPSKNLGSFGEGGCVVTNNQNYYEFAKRYRNYGSVEKYKWELKGANERMHNIQGTILDAKLPYLDEWNNKRITIAQVYDENLKNLSAIQIPKNHEKCVRNYHLYVILSKQREELMNFLKENNIFCAIHYPETFYKSDAFSELNHLNYKADIFKNQLVSLPMHTELTVEDARKVCNTIKKFYNVA